MKTFNELFHIKCAVKNCSDEIIGGIALVISLTAYMIQFFSTEQSLDVSSFSIIALCLWMVGEGLFAIQGYQKGSPTIVLIRIGSCLGFLVFVILWGLDHNKKAKFTPPLEEKF